MCRRCETVNTFSARPARIDLGGSPKRICPKIYRPIELYRNRFGNISDVGTDLAIGNKRAPIILGQRAMFGVFRVTTTRIFQPTFPNLRPSRSRLAANALERSPADRRSRCGGTRVK